MADEGHGDARPLVDRLLEGKDHQHVGDVPLDLTDPPTLPGPDLRRDVIRDRHASALQLAGEAEVEARVVDQNREVVRELIQADFEPARVAREVLALLEDPGRLARVREELGQVRVRLGAPGASDRAAEAIFKYFFMSRDKNLDIVGGYI